MLRRLAPVLLVAFAGCAHFAPTAAQRTASFSAFSEARVDGESLQDYVKSRVAFVSAGLEITRTTEMAGGRLSFHGYSSDRTFNIGTAAAIDRRGYFLTAAHVVTKGPVFVGWLEPDVRGRLGLDVRPARVVWRGEVSGREPDVALLAVDRPLPAAFDWAPAPSRGEAMVSAGLDYGDEARPQNEFTVTTLAGRVTRLSPSARCTVIFHTTPVHEGDSGGPLTDLRGRLLAVNDGYAFVFPYLPAFHTYRAYSDRPDLDALRARIEADVRGAPQAAPTAAAGAAGAGVAGAAGASAMSLRTRSMSCSSRNGLAM